MGTFTLLQISRLQKIQSKNKIDDDAEMMSVKFQTYSFNTQARQNDLLNYRACMGTLLQRMYGHVHIIANFSAIKIQSKNKIDNDAEMMSVNFRSIALIPKLEKVFVKLQSMYGNAITENVWARSHNCKFLGYK